MQHLALDDAPLPSWRQRPKPVGFEITYRLEGAELEIDSMRKIDRVRLDAVELVRFVYAPSNVSMKGYKTQLRLKDGRTITFGNLSWRSLTDLDRDDAGYHRFVTALTAAIVRANPAVRFRAGRSFPMWLAAAIVGGGALLALFGFTLHAFGAGATGSGWLGLALVVASAWQVWPMIRLNRPRDLTVGEVPNDLVPGGEPG